MAKRSGEPDPIGVLKELEDIKRLLMLARVLDAGKKLADAQLVKTTKINGQTA